MRHRIDDLIPSCPLCGRRIWCPPAVLYATWDGYHVHGRCYLRAYNAAAARRSPSPRGRV